MVVGQYDVRLNGDRMPILTQTNTYSLGEEVTITSPDVLVKVLNQFFFLECKAEEYVHMLAVNSAMKPIGFFEISHGKRKRITVMFQRSFSSFTALWCIWNDSCP